MKDFQTFRHVNRNEIEIIYSSLTKISSKITSKFTQFGESLYILINKQVSYKKHPKVFILSEKMRILLKKIDLSNKIRLGGLYFGFLKRGEFYLSLEGAEFLYQNGIFPESHQLYANKNGEKSILYGNHILKKMIVDKLYNFSRNDILLVFNEAGELISLSKAKIDGNNFKNVKPEEIIALNLTDKGIYLRERQ